MHFTHQMLQIGLSPANERALNSLGGATVSQIACSGTDWLFGQSKHRVRAQDERKQATPAIGSGGAGFLPPDVRAEPQARSNSAWQESIHFQPLSASPGANKRSAIMPAAWSSPIAANATYRLPAFTVSQPTKAGQTAPPNEPTALISAIPPAAAHVTRSSGGWRT